VYENDDIEMTKEEELIDVLLDFIAVAASLAKKVNMAMRTKKIKEGGCSNGKVQQPGHSFQRM